MPRSHPLLRRALVALVAASSVGLGVACWPATSPSDVSAPRMVAFTADVIDTTTSTTTTLPPTTEAPPDTEPPPPPPPPPPRRVAPAPAPAPEPAAPVATGSGGQGVTLANNFRTSNGVPALAPAGDANAKAQQHAEDMAARGDIYHSSSLSSGLEGGWSTIGENVGVGPSIGQVESAFEQSSTHRNNLLNGDFNQIGYGWAQGADGRIYVCQIFVGR